MKSLAELIEQWAQEDGAVNPKVEVSAGNHTVEYALSARVGEEDFDILITGFERERLLVLSMYHRNDLVPQERKPEIARLLNCINDQHLRRGNFELTSKQRIRFRDQVASIAEQLPYETMDAMIKHGMRQCDVVLPMIRKVAIAGFSTEAAMTDAQMTSRFIDAVSGEIDVPSPWEHFPGSEAIQRWVASVRTALTGAAEPSADDWRLIGPAIAIEHPYLRIGEPLARRIAADCGIPLHLVAPDGIATLKDNLSAIESVAPILVYLEPGNWQKIEDGDTEDEAADAREQVLDLLSSFNPAHPVFVITVTRSIADVVLILRRHGAFDRCFALPPITPLALGELFLDLVGRKYCAPSLTQAPAKVGKLLDRNFDAPEQRKLAALRMRRRQIELARPLEFIDLVNMDAQGLLESDNMRIEDELLRQRVAWHEAGHAAMALLDSSGQDIPEFTSIVPHGDSNGVVVSSVDYHYASIGNSTYADVCHSIRVSLAGRAAEEVIYGPAGISNGSRTDLANSFRLATDAFACWGFMPGMEGDVPSENNLAVILGKPTPSEYAHLETLVREYLAAQYRLVRETLVANRLLLTAIQARLMDAAILDQQEMALLYAEVKA